MAPIKTENSDALSDDVAFSAESISVCTSSSQFVETCAYVKKGDSNACFDLEKVVKRENGLMSEAEDGTNDTESGKNRIKTEEVDPLADVTLTAEGLLLTTSNGEFKNTSVLTKIEGSVECLEEAKTSVQVSLDSLSSHEGKEDTCCGDVVKKEMVFAPDEFDGIGSSSQEPAISFFVDSEPLITLHDESKSEEGDPLAVPSESLFLSTNSPASSQTEYHLKRQISSHANDKPFLCSKCSSKLKFSCTDCPASFLTKNFLKQHAIIHAGKRPYPCTHCNASFLEKDHLEVHVTVHSRPSSCTNCRASFEAKQLVKQNGIVFSENRMEEIKTEKRDTSTGGLTLSTDTTSFSTSNGQSVDTSALTKEEDLGQYMEEKEGEEGLIKVGLDVCPSFEDPEDSWCGDKAFDTVEMTQGADEFGDIGSCFRAPAASSVVDSEPSTSEYKKSDSLQSHLLVPSTDRPFSYTYRTGSLETEWLLKKHLATHSGEKPFICTQCPGRFTRKSNLMMHLGTHSGEKPFICTECPARFTQKGNLKTHLATHSGQKPFICAECPARFTQNGNLKTHMAIHSDEKPFICTECPARFTQVKNMKRHLATHSGVKPFICTECPAKFNQLKNMKKHLATHSGEKPFICTECPARFKHKENLKMHFATHSGEKPFICTECSARFTMKGNLKKHLVVHSSEKQFICPECPARFNKVGNLKRHLATHSGEKPFICTKCPARFNQLSNLKKHVATHSGEKPFVCTECPARFTQLKNMKRHLTTHSDKKPLNCTE